MGKVYVSACLTICAHGIVCCTFVRGYCGTMLLLAVVFLMAESTAPHHCGAVLHLHVCSPDLLHYKCSRWLPSAALPRMQLRLTIRRPRYPTLHRPITQKRQCIRQQRMPLRTTTPKLPHAVPQRRLSMTQQPRLHQLTTLRPRNISLLQATL